jgi:chromosome segregation ATPase
MDQYQQAGITGTIEELEAQRSLLATRAANMASKIGILGERLKDLEAQVKGRDELIAALNKEIAELKNVAENEERPLPKISFPVK